jgi:hypothetical protein
MGEIAEREVTCGGVESDGVTVTLLLVTATELLAASYIRPETV